MSATVGDSAAGGRSAVEPSNGTGVARGPGGPDGGAGGHDSGGGGRGSGPGDGGGGSGGGGGASTLTGTVRNRTSTEGLLGSPPGRRKVPRETEWTDFVSKDMAESTKANNYYFCEVSEDCCFARGAPFAFPRKRSSFSGGRAAWISHVLKCVDADELAAQGITKLDAISPCAGQLTLDTPVHRGAALFNPAYYLEPNKTAVPVSWNADLLVLLRELFPGEALAGERAFVREHLERMHKHEGPFDDPDCWSAAAKDPLDIGAWWSRYCHLPVEVELDLTPLREAGVIIGSMQASSGEMERMNKVASNQLTKFRTLLTRQHVEDLSHASHFFQQKNARAARLRAAGAKSSDRTPLHESTLFHVHAEAVRELREAEREARAEFVRAQMEDPDFEPLAGGMLALLLSTDADTIAETAAVVDSGDGVARLHAASLAKATTAESQHAENAQARPMAAAPLPPAQRERLTDAGISADAAALWNLRDDDV